MASVHFLCSGCDWRLEARAGEPAGSCENCHRVNGVTAPDPQHPVARCAGCGHDELYVQKDFNRATGIGLVVLGAVFVPWTIWPLVGVTLLDAALYRFVRDVDVCYACRAVHRGYPRHPERKHFDLATHDRHVYGAAPPGAEEGK